MSDLIPFHYKAHEIRIDLDAQNQPWWIATDVGGALGYANIANVLQRLDEDEKGIRSISTLRGVQDLWCLNEAGLYTLILGSKKPEAKLFKRWVTHDVLPTLRTTGSYTTVPVPDPVDRYPELRAIRELIVATAEARDEAALARQEAQESREVAARAETKADLALADSRHQSLEDFVMLNHLLHQFPVTDWPQLGKRLQDYCTLHGLQTHNIPVLGKPWPTETVYPLQALAWLARYPTPRTAVLRFPSRHAY